MNKDEALRLAHEGVEIHSPNAPEYKVCAALIAALETKGEPVAWHYPDGSPEQCTTNKVYAEMNPPWTPMYYTPPQRTWVGLTNDEVNDFAAGCHLGNSVQGAIYKAEAKLKEKNT